MKDTNAMRGRSFGQRMQRASRLAAAAFAAMAILPSAAVTPEFWKRSPYADINATQRELTEVLRDFAGNFGVTPIIADGVSGTVNGEAKAPNAAAFLDRLAMNHRFRWFVNGDRLYISPLSDYQTVKLKVPTDGLQDLKQALRGVGLLEDKFGWGELPSEHAVLVSGPRQYVNMIREYLKSLTPPGPKRAVMVFALKHAWVDDRTISVRGKEIVIPGLASVLRDLMGQPGGTGSSRVSGSLAPPNPPTVANILPRAMGDPGKSAEERDATPRIAADTASNSLLVYDYPKHRAMYQSLVEQLDKPKRMVEIEAVIIDIERAALEELAEACFDEADRHQSSGRTRSRTRRMQILSPTEFRRFYAALSALERQGRASIIASPSVVTQVDQPAVIDLTERAQADNAPPSGALGGDGPGGAALAAEVGSLLSVTPREIRADPTPVPVVAHRGQRRTDPHDQARRIAANAGTMIGLTVELDDGMLDHSLASGAPKLKRTRIHTKVVIAEGRSLLLGGYHLVASTRSAPVKRERLFLLTPTLIGHEQALPPDIQLVGMDGVGEPGVAPRPLRRLVVPPVQAPIPMIDDHAKPVAQRRYLGRQEDPDDVPDAARRGGP